MSREEMSFIFFRRTVTGASVIIGSANTLKNVSHDAIMLFG